jgi:gamma-D-glutamyl-L-lysine dipeptidyl-peptidase
MEEITEFVQHLKQAYAPDKRVALFDVHIRESNGEIILSGETNLPEVKSKLFPEDEKSNLIDSLTLLPAKELEGKIYGVVTISVANLRSNPQHSAELSTQALLGTPIKVFKKQGGWYLVQTPDDYLGWTDNDGFQLMNSEEFDDWKSSRKVVYTNRAGFTFSEDDVSSLPVSDIVEGNILKIISSENDFVYAEFPDKRRAYILKTEVEDFNTWIEEVEPSVENLLDKAKTFMGVPYLWGGTSGKGFDCSGFTKTVFYLNGIILPRDASQQVHTGELVDTDNGFENLQPGDLLFFGVKPTGNSRERITHVAIYIGNNEFIHSSGMVRVNSLDKEKPNFSAYRFNTFIRAKRILNSEGNGVTKLTEHLLYTK